MTRFNASESLLPPRWKKTKTEKQRLLRIEDVLYTITFKDPLTKAAVAECVSVEITQIKTSDENWKLWLSEMEKKHWKIELYSSRTQICFSRCFFLSYIFLNFTVTESAYFSCISYIFFFIKLEYSLKSNIIWRIHVYGFIYVYLSR